MQHSIFSFLLLLCLHVFSATTVAAQSQQPGEVCKASSHISEDKRSVTISSSFILDEGWHLSLDTIVVEECDGLSRVPGSDKRALRFSKDKEDYTVKGYIRYVVCSDTQCLVPKYVDFSYKGKKSDDTSPTPTPAEEKKDTLVTTNKEAGTAAPVSIAKKDTSALWSYIAPPAAHDDGETSDSGLLMLFLLAFLGGLFSLLTPCIWPVIPMTMSFFMKKKGGTKDALFFGACIIATYILFGILITIAFGADAMNGIATNAAFNIACFVVLVLLGASMAGLFTLQLPATWSDRLDSMSSRTSGLLSIFLMSMTLVVVSFSCTAPVVGMLLVKIASDGDVLSPIVGMTGYSMALALPFTLFALFPGILKKVPKSGSWMMPIKVTLGIFEIAFAFKFLSIADQTNNWGIMPRSAFFAIWAILFAGLAVYYFMKVSKPACLIPLAFTAYLITGIFGAPCTLVSAFAPQDDGLLSHIPTYKDYEEGMEAARAAGKPIFLEFTGYGCVNCRNMESAVFSHTEVQEMLQKDFVWIKLYVDDRTATSEKPYRTIGDKWSNLEQVKFHEQSQPYYIVLNADGHPLIAPHHYKEDVKGFCSWLQTAIDRFRQ